MMVPRAAVFLVNVTGDVEVPFCPNEVLLRGESQREPWCLSSLLHG
jgi:hypothetical protein